MAENYLRVTKNDFDGTPVTVSIPLRTEAFATQQAKSETLFNQLESWSVGRLQRRDNIRGEDDNGPGASSDPNAQSKRTMILEIEDSVTGIIYREKYPMPDMNNAADGGGNAAWVKQGQGQNSVTVMNPLHAEAITLKAAYDAVGVSPAGNDATLKRVYIER